MVEFAIEFGENTSLLEKYDMAVDPSRYVHICISIYIYQTFCTSPRNSVKIQILCICTPASTFGTSCRQLAAWERDDWYGHHNPVHSNMYMHAVEESQCKKNSNLLLPRSDIKSNPRVPPQPDTMILLSIAYIGPFAPNTEYLRPVKGPFMVPFSEVWSYEVSAASFLRLISVW
jgi:hypothetical protein